MLAQISYTLEPSTTEHRLMLCQKSIRDHRLMLCQQSLFIYGPREVTPFLTRLNHNIPGHAESLKRAYSDIFVLKTPNVGSLDMSILSSL